MDNAQVVHLWANQAKGHAKTGNGNLSFNGNVLLSYATEIGRIFKNGIVVYTSYSHSVTTTGKHLVHIPNAISHLDSYRVSCPMKDIPADWESATPIIFVNLLSQFRERVETLRKARTSILVKMQRCQDIVDQMRCLAVFVEILRLGISNNEDKDMLELSRVFYEPVLSKNYATNEDLIEKLLELGIDIRAKLAKEEEINQARIVQMLAEKQRRAEEQKEKTGEWRSGIFHGMLYDLPVMLRIDNYRKDVIQTSHGAEVSFVEATHIFSRLLNGQDLVGVKIGHFTILAVNDQYIKVGCHTILREEIDNFFRGLIL